MGGARMNGLDRHPHRLIFAFTLEGPLNRATYLMSLDRFAPIGTPFVLGEPELYPRVEKQMGSRTSRASSGKLPILQTDDADVGLVLVHNPGPLLLPR
jgi:hypothetical protein